MKTQTNTYQLWAGRLLAFVGMFFPIAANFIPPSDKRAVFFLLGGILMTVATVIEREMFFFVLQSIVVVGAGMYFVPVPILKILLPCLISASFIAYCYQQGKLSDKSLILGLIGISLLSLGYGIGHPVIYLFGGIFLAIYSGIAYYNGVKIAIIWAVLNLFFTFAVLYNLFHF